MSAVIVPFPRERIVRSPDLRKHIARVYRHFLKDEPKAPPADHFHDAVKWHYHFPRDPRAWK